MSFPLQTVGRKASIVWRAMHLSALVTLAGVLVAFVKPESANGVGVMLGAFQLALGGFVSTYAHSQGRVDVAETTAREPHPKRASGTMTAVSDA